MGKNKTFNILFDEEDNERKPFLKKSNSNGKFDLLSINNNNLFDNNPIKKLSFFNRGNIPSINTITHKEFTSFVIICFYRNYKNHWRNIIASLILWSDIVHVEILFPHKDQSFTTNQKIGEVYYTQNKLFDKKGWCAIKINVTEESYHIMYNYALKLVTEKYKFNRKLYNFYLCTPYKFDNTKISKTYICSTLVIDILVKGNVIGRDFHRKHSPSPSELYNYLIRSDKNNKLLYHPLVYKQKNEQE